METPVFSTFEGGNTIAYIYDAAGIKLSKVVTESGQPVKTTDYIGGIIYEDDARKFISTEEGRIIPELVAGSVDYEYQYHMKDHLGNVRLTFSTKEQVSTYMATMESAATTLEEATFDNISSTQHSNALYNHTSGGTYSARLNAADSKVMGPAMSLHVMQGDTIRTYLLNTPVLPTAPPP